MTSPTTTSGAPLKILHCVLTDGFYGSEMACAQAALGQVQVGQKIEGGVEVRVLIRGRCPAAVARFKALVGPERVVALPTWWPSLLEGWAARRVMLGFEPDLVHTHLGQASRVVGRAAQKLGIPAVGTLHLRYKPRNDKHLDGLVAIAGWQETAARSRGYEKPIVTIWNALQPMAAPNPEAVAALRQAWGAGQGVKVLMSVGRLVPQKGFAELIAAFRQLTDPQLRLVIVGEGPERARLEAEAAGDARVILAGYRSDIKACLHAADAFALASHTEAFGLVLLEALQAGLPVASTRTEGPQEFLRAYPMVWAELDNPPSLTEALRQVVQQPKQAYDLGPFDPHAASLRHVAFYREVMAVARKKQRN